MRGLAAILILVVGAGLGYGWHEVSPRVLGSAPFCGPKYPGMLRAIPEGEYFPERMFTEDSSFTHRTVQVENEETGEADWEYLYDPWLASTFENLGEPSLWAMAQQDTIAIRWMRLRPFDYTSIVTVTLDDTHASVRAHHISGPYSGQLLAYDTVETELPEQVANDLWHSIVGTEYGEFTSSVWRKCTERNSYPIIWIDEDFVSGFMSGGHSDIDVLEISDEGRYTFVSESGGMWPISESFQNLSGLPVDPTPREDANQLSLPDRSLLELNEEKME